MIADTPYGITQEAWDTAWTAKDLDIILKQIAAQNSAKSWAVFFWHTAYDTQKFMDALKGNNYTEAQQFVWHKTNHATQTSVSGATSSWEIGTLAFYPSRVKCNINNSLNPTERHNFLEFPQLTRRYKDTAGQVANPCQKPQQVASWIIEKVAMPGSTVLVLGPGAGGGEVLGALNKGCNVVAVEKNEYQFTNLHTHLLMVKQQLAKEDADAKEAAEKEDKSVIGSQSFSGGDQGADIGGGGSSSSKPVKCTSCSGVITGPMYVCSNEECSDEGVYFHESCTVEREGVRICVDCKEREDRQAQEAETQEQEEQEQ